LDINATLQPYKYNSKELDTADGLNLYDYGARHYDAAICRWNAVDALAEKNYNQSPYSYCVGNPIIFVDPCGKDTFRISDNVNIMHIEGGKNDIFTNANGDILATIKGNQTQLKHIPNGENLGYDILMFHDRKNAEKVFKAIADQSKNEWSLIETSEYGKGFVSTSYGRMEERANILILNNLNRYKISNIWRHIHSHPNVRELHASQNSGDMDVIKKYMNTSGVRNAKWYIYGPAAGYMLQYHYKYPQRIVNINEIFRFIK